jgi:hypothetical protein
MWLRDARRTGATPNKSVPVVEAVSAVLVVDADVLDNSVPLIPVADGAGVGGAGVGAGDGFSVSNPVSTVAIVCVGYGVGFGVGGFGVGFGVYAQI